MRIVAWDNMKFLYFWRVDEILDINFEFVKAVSHQGVLDKQLLSRLTDFDHYVKAPLPFLLFLMDNIKLDGMPTKIK